MCCLLRRIVPGLTCALALAALGHRLTTRAHAAEPAAPPTQSAAAHLALKSGDRVVLLGGTFIEREQKYGYFEAALVSRFPGEKIIVRNLGWSGDTVWCDSRAGFGSPADGFARLSRQLQELKPTVAIVAYGNNEAYAGPAGLDRFLSGLKTLLDALAPGGARIVLVSPLEHENLGPPLADPVVYNQHAKLYSDALARLAAERGLPFVNLLRSTQPGRQPGPAAVYRQRRPLHGGRLLAGRAEDAGRSGTARHALAGRR